MRWFRSNGGRFVWLALFALACQFVFTFGHVHLRNVGAASTVITADAPYSPAQKTPTGLARDICAVCNNISLANALVLPLPPAMVPPGAFVGDLQWPLVAARFVSRDQFHFDARGPPHA
jgi:hypothetical protein